MHPSLSNRFHQLLLYLQLHGEESECFPTSTAEEPTFVVIDATNSREMFLGRFSAPEVLL
jgi:hypothetical protein